jgi:hypothetical protein
MFRCHMTRDRQIVWGDYLEASSLDEARAESARLLRQRAELEADGFEIWSGTTLLLTEEVMSINTVASPVASLVAAPLAAPLADAAPSGLQPVA